MDARHPLHEERESLWLLTFAPGLWMAHFLVSYLTVSIWCAKFAGSAGDLSGAHVVIAISTVLVLAGIAVIGWKGYRRHRLGSSSPPHDFDTPEDRHRFLGFATLLLAGLSFVATAYISFAAMLFETCR